MRTAPSPPTANVFRIGAQSRVLLVILAIVVGSLTLFGALFFASHQQAEAAWIVGVMGGIFAALLLVGVRWAYCASFEILPHGLRRANTFGGVVELGFDEIKGYRVTRTKNSRYFTIVPTEPGRRSFTVDSSFERWPELLAWLEGNLPNLDAEDYQAELASALADERLGTTEDERQAALVRAKRCVNGLNVAAFVVTFWTFAIARPYDVSIVACALLPVVALGLRRLVPAMRLSTRKKGPRPNSFAAVVMPVFALCLRAGMDWNLLDGQSVALPMFGSAALLLGLALAVAPEVRGETAAVVLLALASLAYGFGVVVPINGEFDRSKPATFATAVVGRDISHGKSASYYVTLRPWLGADAEKRLQVSRAFYVAHPERTPVTVFIRDGALGIKWFTLR